MNEEKSITFRAYKERDYAELKEMIFGLATEDIDPSEKGIPMSEAKIESTVLRSITHPGQLRIKIFEINDTIVGYSLLTFYWSNEYHGVVAIVDELYVKPAYRNQQISTRFISHLAENKEYAMLQLEVFKKNHHALRFYQRMQFEIVERDFMIKKL
jgi:ribosomal protein S18 acetylase RimI-like enzyme